MDVTALDNQLAALREGEAAIAKQLAEVDTNLGNWMAAVEFGQELLQEQARACQSGAATADVAEIGAAVPTCGPDGEPAEPDENALLESLDADTANAIRVKRRLGSDKRNLRELLDEVRATQARMQESAAQRRGFWRRRRD